MPPIEIECCGIYPSRRQDSSSRSWRTSTSGKKSTEVLDLQEASPFSCSLRVGGSVDHIFVRETLYIRYYRITRAYDCPLTDPPPIAVRTFRRKLSRLDRRSSAASLFKGSEALGSRNRNCFRTVRCHLPQLFYIKEWALHRPACPR